MEDITGLTFIMDGEAYVLHNGAADGRMVSLVPRSQAVALMEAVNAIVLK